MPARQGELVDRSLLLAAARDSYAVRAALGQNFHTPELEMVLGEAHYLGRALALETAEVGVHAPLPSLDMALVGQMHASGIDRHNLREQRSVRRRALVWVVSRLLDPAGLTQADQIAKAVADDDVPLAPPHPT